MEYWDLKWGYIHEYVWEIEFPESPVAVNWQRFSYSLKKKLFLAFPDEFGEVQAWFTFKNAI